MMKIFTSFRFTGEDMNELKQFMKEVCTTLEGLGHKQYCNFWREDYEEPKRTMKEIMDIALRDLDDADCYLAIVKSDEKSEGMLIEAGYALAKGKRIIIAIKKGVKTTWMRNIFEEVIEWNDIENLKSKIKEIK